MSYEDLMKKINRVRNARVDARAAAANKPTRQSRPKADKTKKLVKDLSPEEKAQIIALLESKDES